MHKDDFFGFDLNIKKFEINMLLDLIGIRRKIEAIASVKQISKKFGDYSPFTNVAKRQQALKFLEPLLVEEFYAFDPHYYTKEVNTATQHDRRYNAEERILELGLIIAAGRTYRELTQMEFKPNLRALRELSGTERFERLWDVLLQEEHNTITEFKKALKS